MQATPEPRVVIPADAFDPAISLGLGTTLTGYDPAGRDENPAAAPAIVLPSDLACWATFTGGTAIAYPLGGYGETTAIAAESLLASDEYTLIDGLVIDKLDAAAKKIDIRTADDATSIYEVLAPAANAALALPIVVRFPQPLAILVPWGVKLEDADVRVRVHFRRAHA